jgi:Tol biopolymer transport system component
MKNRIVIVIACGATLAVAALNPQFAGDARGQGFEPVEGQGWTLQPKIVWATTRDDPAINPLLAGEIYMMNTDLTGVQRITFTENAADFFPVLSPTGKRMVFDSNRLRGSGPINTSDLFLMNPDGSDHVHIVRGSSATWSPDGHRIAFHASASGTGLPIRVDPGSATSDSDIFVLSVDEFLQGAEPAINLTNSPDYIDDDPDWSPDGTQLLFTRHGVNDPHGNSSTAEIHVMSSDGVAQLTFNSEEERGPDWSPDGSRIAYACRKGENATFEICIMNADGTGQTQLTFNLVPDLTPTWSLDGTQIVFHRFPVAGRAQLFRMNADGTNVVQITDSAGVNVLASQGVVKVTGLPGK